LEVLGLNLHVLTMGEFVGNQIKDCKNIR